MHPPQHLRAIDEKPRERFFVDPLKPERRDLRGKKGYCHCGEEDDLNDKSRIGTTPSLQMPYYDARQPEQTQHYERH
ncbi:hypothetical protein D3C72_1291150 [compost metagenome]